MRHSIESEKHTETANKCHHCGEPCDDEIIVVQEHTFCCEGCKLVYEILEENGLCQYYTIDGAQGISPKSGIHEGKFDYLDLPDVRKKMVVFESEKLTVVNWHFPKMHCSSCIWLLEHLDRLNPAVRNVVVDFPDKTARITFEHNILPLSGLAHLLAQIGYEPYLSLDDLEKKISGSAGRQRLYKIGIAGFAFGNIMMLSFPEYFHLGNGKTDEDLRTLFGLLNIALSLPVLFYCAADFFKSAWAALKGRYLNIDGPIALALSSGFLTSIYQIATQSGPGYLDSFAGAVFFMLIGRYFQDKTYAGISFERDYKSYFPIAVTVINGDSEEQKQITELEKGDLIRIKNEELIPADAVLLSHSASIDYSFVSGESAPVSCEKGDTIYAGGKHQGTSIDLQVLRKVSQSYLTQLWNHEAFSKSKVDHNQTLASRINRYFSAIVICIAVAAFAVWFFVFQNAETAFLAFTTTLLVACPCALVLSSTFTNGNLLSLFGKNGFYLKNAFVIEQLSKIDTVVFDKTGTITSSNQADVLFQGGLISEQEWSVVKAVASHSSHPLSRLVLRQLAAKTSTHTPLTDFKEVSGAGIEAFWRGNCYRLGSAKWTGADENISESGTSKVYISINSENRGHFIIKSNYRSELENIINRLSEKGIRSFLLSGDKPVDQTFLSRVFKHESNLFFNQKPHEKLGFVESLQQTGRKVMMVGDGLNDAGALRQSEVGLAVSDNINNFSPSCDAMIEGKNLGMLPGYISMAKAGQRIIKQSFAISLIYNITGLAFAITGSVSPVFAAILMPVSSFTIVAFTTLASNAKAGRFLKS